MPISPTWDETKEVTPTWEETSEATFPTWDTTTEVEEPSKTTPDRFRSTIGAAPEESLISRARKSLTPLLGPTEEQKLREGVIDAQGRPQYKPLGSDIEREGLFPALSKPFVAIPSVDANDPGFIGGLSIAIGRVPSSQERVMYAGVFNTAKSFVEFLESPLGVATAGLNASIAAAKTAFQGAVAGGDVAQVIKATENLHNVSQANRAVQAAFAADIASKVPEQARQLGRTTVTGTPQQIAEAGLGTATSIILPGFLGAHAAKAPTLPEILAPETLKAASAIPTAPKEPTPVVAPLPTGVDLVTKETQAAVNEISPTRIGPEIYSIESIMGKYTVNRDGAISMIENIPDHIKSKMENATTQQEAYNELRFFIQGNKEVSALVLKDGWVSLDESDLQFLTPKQREVYDQWVKLGKPENEGKSAAEAVGKESNAVSQPIPTSVSQPEIRPPVGQETPLRQPGEVAAAQAPIPPSPEATPENVISPTTLAPSGTEVKTTASEPGTTAPATFAGIQEGAGTIPSQELWHLTEDIPGHPKGSTLTRTTLEKEGYTVPPAEPAKPAPEPTVNEPAALPKPVAEAKPAPEAPVEAAKGGVPYYRKLGEQDAADPARKRMRAVPQNFKLAYLNGWYEAKKPKPTPAEPTPAAPSAAKGGDWRSRLRSKQDEVIAIAENRGFEKDIPISEVQVGAPSINDLRTQLHPDFEPSLNAFLEAFREKKSEAKPPPKVAEKAQKEVSRVARTEGTRAAKSIKEELVSRIQSELDAVEKESGLTTKPDEYKPDRYEIVDKEGKHVGYADVESSGKKFEASFKPRWDSTLSKVTGDSLESVLKQVRAIHSDGAGKVTIEIPGDGTFSVWRTGRTLAELLKRAKRINPKSDRPGQTKYKEGQTGFTDTQKQAAEDARIKGAADYAEKLYGGPINAAEVYRRQIEVQGENLEPKELYDSHSVLNILEERAKADGNAADISKMKRSAMVEELASYGITETFTGGYTKNLNATDLKIMLAKARKERNIPLKPTEAKAEPKAGGMETDQGAIATAGPPLTPAAPSPVPVKTPKSQRQIITDLAKGLKLPIRFGRLRTTKFAGYFQKVQNLIGSKKANDIPIVSHEVGHKLDAEFGFASDPALKTELDALGDPSSPGSRSSWTPSKTKAYKLREGVAEFVRHWLVDPPEAARLAPNMLRRFEDTLDANKDFGDTMRQAQEDIQVWRNAAPQARLRSHISVGENPNKTRYRLGDLWRDVVDDLHFMRLAVDDAQALSKSTLSPSNNPYLLARTLRGSYGMADTFIRHGVSDFKTKAVTLGTGLVDALKPVAGRINDFRDWIVAKQAKELHAQGKETGLVPSDVDFVVNKFDSDPAFQEAFGKVKAWNDALLQYAIDAGLVEKGTPRTPTEGPTGSFAIREMNQDYVPFHRVFEVGAGEPPSAEGAGTGRGLNVGKPGSLRRRTGSPRDIVDPLETMVRNAYSLITASEKTAINRAVADMSTSPGMGKWVEHIATPKESVKVGIEKIREQLEAAGADLTAVPDDILLQFFQNSQQAPFGENVIKIVREGKPEYYRLRRELFDTFHALDLEDSGKLVQILSYPSQILRSGVTAAPDFALANAMRDAFSSAIVSRHGLFPFEATIRGISAMLKDPKLIAEWEAAGGKNSIEANYFDRSKLQDFLAKRITKDLTPAERAMIVAKSPLTALRWLTGLSEEATRIGEYQKAFNDLTSKGMPEGEARRLAAFESRDRQDFAKGGAKTKIIRRMAAFWNAALQGNVRLAQAFKERPIETALKGLAFITLPKLLEQQLNWDDEDYWDRPQWERDLFFLIPAGKSADGHTRFIRIPVPFEAGIIFGTFPGRLLQMKKQNDPEAMKSFPSLLAKQTVPNPTPQWALAVYEDFMTGKKGWDVFRQRPIVPERIAQYPTELQWTEQTSLTAKKLGSLLNISPMKIDHLVNTTTGGLGKELIHQVVDRAISIATGEKPTAKGTMPGSRFVTTPAYVASQSIEDFYTTLDELKTMEQGVKLGKEPTEKIAWAGRFTETARDLAELRDAMRHAESQSEKDAYAEQILKVAKQTMGEYRQALKEIPAPK